MSYAGLSQYNFIGTCQVSGFYVNRYKKFYVEYLGFWKYMVRVQNRVSNEGS